MKRLSLTAALFVATCAAAAADDALPTIGVDELERGQKGWGVTVFAGTEPQRFEVEVLGITRNRTPELSFILARLSGPEIEQSGVFRGMSGSPVYFDGRLAGAVSFSYLFGVDAVAGITPIDAMRKLGAVAAPGDGRPAAAAPRLCAGFEWEDLVRRDFRPELLEERFAALAPSRGGEARTTFQWSASGFGEASSRLLGRALGSLGPGGMIPLAASGGGGAGTAAEELQPGGSVAAVLIRGDLHVAGYGTVTERQGDDILAFGHPLFALGPVKMPMAPSEVVTVIASHADSFKIANVGPVVGAFDQDRQAGAHGRIGLTAPMIPVTVRLRGLTERTYSMEVLDVPQLTPGMIALAAYGSLEAGSFSAGAQGLDLEARFRLAGHGDLVVRQSFDSLQAGIESVVYLMGFGSFLKLNDLAEVVIEAVEVDFHQVDRPRTATLVGAHLDRREAKPGETVGLILELQAYRGERYRQVVETTVPADAPDGRFAILVGDGTSMDAVRLAVERRVPQTFEQALELMRSFRPRSTLRIFGLVPRPGLTVAGEVLPQLPGSVRSIFASGSAGGTALGLAIVHEQETRLDRPIAGYQRVDLEVRRR